MGGVKMSAEGNSEGGWPGGWLAAVVTGVIAAILARWLGDVGMAAAVLVGIFVFLVFGVLLGMFWAAPATADHDTHGHDAQGHDDHGHQPAATAVTAAAPAVAVAPTVVMPAPVAAPDQTPVAAAPVMAAPVVSAPVAAPPVMAAPAVSGAGGTRPVALSGPRGGMADNLQTLEGIGPALEKLCHELGVFHFDQIAGWGAGEVAWMDGNLKGFKGRVTRDKWVRQARLIGEVGIPEFLRRAKTNDY